MLKKMTAIFVFALLFAVASKSQWVNQGAWPDTSVQGQLHAIAVDPDGKVWAGNFGAEQYVPDGTTDTLTVRLIRVYNPDGSPASFSPIWSATVGGVTDTLTASSRGMRADNNGNIIYANGLAIMYRFNYQTGEAMNKVVLQMTTSPTAPGVADNGNIFVGPVVNANQPIEEYDTDFNYLGNAVTFTEDGFSRSMEVSADGNTIYFPSYSRGIVLVYQRPDEFSAFDSVGTIFDGFHCESITWNHATGYLWASAGSYNDLPDSGSGYTPNTWYAYDFATQSVVDSLKWEFTTPEDPGERPRGLDFSPDGNTAYVGIFGASGVPLVQKLDKVTSIKEEKGVIVNSFELSQNYPNPFNPSTEIKFTVVKTGFVTLKVYDLLGREVASLVNEEMNKGAYSVNFDATNLASGTYVYQINANGVQISKKMMLLK
ncbi:MAG: T9SS type A sorting domain-containing protein [Ignavibacteriaceae bacterium]